LKEDLEKQEIQVNWQSVYKQLETEDAETAKTALELKNLVLRANKDMRSRFKNLVSSLVFVAKETDAQEISEFRSIELNKISSDQAAKLRKLTADTLRSLTCANNAKDNVKNAISKIKD